MFGLLDCFAEDENENRLEENYREKGEDNALSEYKSQVVTYTVIHKEQCYETADSSKHTCRDGRYCLRQSSDKRVFRLGMKFEFLVISMHQEYRIVHRDCKLEYRSARRGNRRDSTYGVRTCDYVGTHIQKYGYTQRSEEYKRLEIAVRGEQQNNKTNQHSCDKELRHIAERRLQHRTCVLRSTAYVIPFGCVGRTLSVAVCLKFSDLFAEYVVDFVECSNRFVIAAGSLEVDRDYVSFYVFRNLFAVCGSKRYVCRLDEFFSCVCLSSFVVNFVNHTQIVESAYPYKLCGILAYRRFGLQCTHQCSHLFLREIGNCYVAVTDDVVLVFQNGFCHYCVGIVCKICDEVAFLVDKEITYDCQYEKYGNNHYDSDFVRHNPLR